MEGQEPHKLQRATRDRGSYSAGRGRFAVVGRQDINKVKAHGWLLRKKNLILAGLSALIADDTLRQSCGLIRIPFGDSSIPNGHWRVAAPPASPPDYQPTPTNPSYPPPFYVIATSA